MNIMITGIQLNKPRKVAIMYSLRCIVTTQPLITLITDIIFSFEIDTLEIVLKEQVDIVDKFFLGRKFLTSKIKY